MASNRESPGQLLRSYRGGAAWAWAPSLGTLVLEGCALAETEAGKETAQAQGDTHCLAEGQGHRAPPSHPPSPPTHSCHKTSNMNRLGQHHVAEKEEPLPGITSAATAVATRCHDAVPAAALVAEATWGKGGTWEDELERKARQWAQQEQSHSPMRHLGPGATVLLGKL